MDEVSRAAVVRQALGNPRLRHVLAAFLLFNIHEWAVYLTLLVWAYGEGGASAVSLLALVQLVPSALLATPLSALLMRFSSWSALVVGYGAQTLSLLVLGAVLLADLSFVYVGAAAAVAAVAVTLTRPAHLALLPQIADTTSDLTASNAGSGAVEAAATFVGPLACGALLAVMDPSGVVLVMAGGSAGSVIALLGAGRGTSGSAATAPPATERAVRTIVRDPGARLLCTMVAAENVLIGMMDILLVLLALDLLEMSDSGPGVLNAALGVGGLVGAAVALVLIGRRRMAPAVLLGAVVAGLPLALAGLTGAPVAALALLTVCGAGKLFFDVATRTLIQRLLPDRLLTAVFGIAEALMMAGLALGALLAPLLIHVLGARLAFVAAGVFLPLVVVLATGRLRSLDRATEVPADVLALLRGVPLLAVLAPRVVERLALEAVPVSAVAGEVVIAEGTPGHTFYVVSTGSVRVTIEGEQVADLGPGAWFGELALLRESERTATVTALTDLELQSVGRDAFLTSVGLSTSSRDVIDDHAREHYR